MKLGFFTFWNFAAVSQLRNEVHCAAKSHSCAKTCFAIAKYSTEWDFWCEIRLCHFAMRFAAAKQMLLCCEVALVCQKWFRSCENFHREGYWAANWFRSKVSISQRLRNLADPCFCPVFAIFLLRKTSFQFLCIFSYLRSFKKTKLHINTELVHCITYYGMTLLCSYCLLIR